MQKKLINTRLGPIAVYTNDVINEKIPVLLIHGVYFDHRLWNNQITRLNNRRVVTIDMPWHGDSREHIQETWTLLDCAEMLIDIFNYLKIPEVMAIGHSWGSMTLLRAANLYPERFVSLGFCNMPFQPASAMQKIKFKIQHRMLFLRNFYMRQAGKFLYGKNSLQKNPELFQHLLKGMARMSDRQIRSTDQFVILDAEDSSGLIRKLQVPAMAMKGEEDYVPEPPGLETELVGGGHISPLEEPEKVLHFIHRVVKMGEDTMISR